VDDLEGFSDAEPADELGDVAVDVPQARAAVATDVGVRMLSPRMLGQVLDVQPACGVDGDLVASQGEPFP